MRVKEFAIKEDGEQVMRNSQIAKDKKELKLVDVLQDLQTKEVIEQRCKCLANNKILESSDEDSEEIDEL